MGWAQEQVLAPRKDKTEGSLDRPWGQDFARIMVVLRSLGTSEPPCPGSDGDSHHPPPPSALQVVLRLQQARVAGHGKLPDPGWCWQSLSPARSPCLHGCPAKGCDYLCVTEEYAEAQERHFSISVACSKPQSRSLCPSPLHYQLGSPRLQCQGALSPPKCRLSWCPCLARPVDT